METLFFAVNGSNLHIGTLNIHGIRNKLEADIMTEWILKHDIILLCETMTDSKFTVPGYTVIIGKTNNAKRGGVALLVRNCLEKYITEIDLSEHDQIWFRLSNISHTLFGACYVPPYDSPYYMESNHSFILGKSKDNPGSTMIVFGDLNSRIGKSITELEDEENHYTPVDDIGHPSSHGRKLLNIMKDCNLLMVNNLTHKDKTFKGDLTFRKRQRWISEIDVYLISKCSISMIKNFHVDQRLDIPSDHAPISVALDVGCINSNLSDVRMRADELGLHAASRPVLPVHKPDEERPRRRRPVSCDEVSQEIFQEKLGENMIYDKICTSSSIEQSIEEFSQNIYRAASESRDMESGQAETTAPDDNRWLRIMNSNDDKALWKCINWKGELSSNNQNRPSDEEFQEHLEEVMNPPDVTPILEAEYRSAVYTPVLDDPIEPQEVEHVIKKQLKPKKSPGFDGISPGLFRWLPVHWLLTLTFILNTVFYTTYPARWSYAKLSMLFKKGDRSNCDNFRGISVIEAMSKIYDYVLYNRLTKWFIPDREQAGAQSKRSCIEHIMTLRLLFSYSSAKKLKLFVVFVDFSKAYDRVPRDKLLRTLIRLGCGMTMLLALVAMYTVTRSILGTAVITSAMGVRQGSPTSCFLFIVFVNTLIRMMKERCSRDGFLGWLHLLILMDDTVILATSRERLIEKLDILHEYCITHGMLINIDKTKLMVINGNEADRMDIDLYGMIIKHCWKYVYLGSIFTSDGSLVSSLKEHCKAKQKHLHKLIMFLKTNIDIPFPAKRKVVEAAFNAAILYGCESWLGASCQCVRTLYMGGIKVLLGVRPTTANDLCLIELGLPTLESFIKSRQSNFLKNIMIERQGMEDDPLMFVLELTRTGNRRMTRYIDNVCSTDNHIADAINNLHDQVNESQRTKFITYREINPDLSVHMVYSKRLIMQCYIPESYRISFTRLRLSSHQHRLGLGYHVRTDCVHVELSNMSATY